MVLFDFLTHCGKHYDKKNIHLIHLLLKNSNSLIFTINPTDSPLIDFGTDQITFYNEDKTELLNYTVSDPEEVFLNVQHLIQNNHSIFISGRYCISFLKELSDKKVNESLEEYDEIKFSEWSKIYSLCREVGI